MIRAAADGSALSNPGPAGWAWYIDDERWASGGWPHGTNNMGELMAVLDLLVQTAVTDEPLHVLCDSQYAINAISKWMPNWKRKGWRKADGKPVLNVELLKQLDAAMTGRDVTFEWVKGHAGHEMNEKADDLARAAATAFRDGTPVAHGPGFSGAAPATPLDVHPGQVDDEDLFSVAPAATGDDDLVTELVALTRDLLDNDTRTSTHRLEQLLHPDLVRHDSHGRVQTYRRLVLGMDRIDLRPGVEVLGLDQLADDVAVLRWRLVMGSRRLLVASTWLRVDARWRLRLEQVTPIL
ncbi:RNase H family protein [Propionibacteriaceae bacterium G1746]